MAKHSFDAWAWKDALHLFKHGEPDWFEELLRDPTKPVPDYVRTFLADVMTGKEKLPARDTRIKLNYKTKLHIQKAVLALGHRVEWGVMTKARARTLKKMEMDRIATEIGATFDTVRQTWGEYERQYADSFQITADTRKWLDSEKRGYSGTRYRMGKKVQMKS